MFSLLILDKMDIRKFFKKINILDSIINDFIYDNTRINANIF